VLTFKTHDPNHESKTNLIERKPKKIIKQNSKSTKYWGKKWKKNAIRKKIHNKRNSNKKNDD